ncbi:hypothetical protein SAMN04488082_108108 [Desulfomicrobium apsheronum]|uniref:Uncharacterized protein n=2 Tax=Desulfomicrobium apsheronum TaxID=52560 RepID=A0A1I3UT33_9BACT|nr:hypothetical protein SAMN04488082_108108 [Desulfomicrobium apsheronum]
MVMPNPSARQVLELEGISEKLCEPLGWYLWLANAQGVHSLELLEADAEGRSCFLIRFFPSLAGHVLNCLSEEEKQLRQSELFDATGTPVQSDGRELDPELFAVGTFTLARHGNGEGSLEVVLTTMPGWTRTVSWTLYDTLVSALCHHLKFSALRGESVLAWDNQSWRVHCELAPSNEVSRKAGGATSILQEEWQDPWLNPVWWQPECLGISLHDVEYPE